MREYYKLVDECIVVVELKDWVGPQKLGHCEVNDATVSTVFLGVEHHGGMFETMIFGGPASGFMLRVDTVEQAKKVHEKVVDVLRSSNWFQWHLNSESIRPKLISEISAILPKE